MNQHSPTAKFFARALSILFHPVFVPTLVYAFFLACSPDFFFGVSEHNKTWWLVILAYITITFPLLVVFLLWRLKFIDSMQMHGLKERYGPMIASMLFYFWTFWLFHKQFEAPLLLQSFLLGVFLATVLLFLASIFVKISLHTGAWGSVVVYAIICTFQQVHLAILLLLLSILIAGLIGTARLYLGAHSNKQLYAGYLLGGLAQLLAFLLCKTYL